MLAKFRLPFDTLSEAQSWVATVNAGEGYPNGATTYTSILEYNGKFSVFAKGKVHKYMTPQQIQSLMSDVESLALGYVPTPEGLPT